MIAFDQPGTTRDTVEVPFERDGLPYVLIDTAGVRRKSKVSETVEKFSVVKTLQAIDRANVVIGVLDAHDTVAEQDASLMGLVAEQAPSLVGDEGRDEGARDVDEPGLRPGGAGDRLVDRVPGEDLVARYVERLPLRLPRDVARVVKAHADERVMTEIAVSRGSRPARKSEAFRTLFKWSIKITESISRRIMRRPIQSGCLSDT